MGSEVENIIEQSEEFKQEVWDAINAYRASTSPQLPYDDNFVNLLIEAIRINYILIEEITYKMSDTDKLRELG